MAAIFKSSLQNVSPLPPSRLKFCKDDLNMAAINFSPLQNLKWL